MGCRGDDHLALELHKIMLSLAGLAIMFYASLFAWYEGSGSRSEVDAAYRDYYDDDWQKNQTKTTRYWGRLGLCDGLADASDCDGVRNGSHQRAESGIGKTPIYERDPVTFWALHLGAVMGIGLFWVVSLALIVVGAWYVMLWADRKWPKWWLRSGFETHGLYLMRQGFLLLWLMLLGLIWVLVWHVVTR